VHVFKRFRIRPTGRPTVVEVGRDAGLHDAGHVTHRGQTLGAGREEGQDGECPRLPVQPGDDVRGEGFACGHAHSVEQGQGVDEQTAQRHVPLLQTALWGGHKRRGEMITVRVTVLGVTAESTGQQSTLKKRRNK